MRLSQKELGAVGAIIVYIAFFTHPPPAHIQNFLESIAGKLFALLGILYVAVYQSLIVGVFLAIAFIFTATAVTEYMDNKHPTPEPKKEEKKQPTSSGVPPPAVTGALKSLLKKGDNRLPQAQGKSDTNKPTSVIPPKPTPPKAVENFASF